MTTYIIFSDVVGVDGELVSTSTNYTTARNGTGTFATPVTPDGICVIGQDLSGTTYRLRQCFVQFDLSSIGSDQLLVSAYLDLFNKSTVGTAARDIEFREFDFGSSLTSADWRNPTQFAALPYYSDIRLANGAGSGLRGLRGGSEQLKTRIATGSTTLRMVGATSRFRQGNAPTSSNPSEYNSVYHSSQAGTTQDPMLVVESISQSTMVHVGGQGSIQLSNGNHFFLEFNGSTVTPAIVGKYHNGTSASTVVTLSLVQSFDADHYALQRFAVCADLNDNIYIFGQNGDDFNALSAKCLVRNPNTYTWVEKPTISGDMPAYFNAGSSVINNIVAVWHQTSGAGNVMVFIGHQAWTDDTNMLQYAITSCAAMQAGSGTLITKAGSVEEFMDLKNSTELIAYPNETGTGIDCIARGSYPGANAKGNFLTYDSDGLARFCSYSLLGSTTLQVGYSTVFNVPITKDPNSKCRMIPIDFNRYIAIAGNSMIVWLWEGGILSSTTLTAANVTSTPTSDQFMSTTNWDCVYDPASNKLYVYYLDFNDSNRLMRTSYDCAAYAWTGEETEVDAAIGAVGSTNLSVRCPRQWVYGRRVQVAVANLASGTHSTIYNYDSINVAPTLPTLNTRAAFDADDPATFTWTFVDANKTDKQSAYQLQVWNAGATSIVYDSGKVTSASSQHVLPGGTIANNTNYQWRVRTYDLDDAVSFYSQYSTTSTSNAAIVTITFPATDNPPNYEDSAVPLQWTVTGAAQDHYRLKVYVNADNTLFSDTGSVASSQGVRTVSNLLSGVEYRFELTVTSSGVDSVVAIRYLTPDYANPEVPILNVDPLHDSGYVLLSVVNPPPDGDRPNVTTNLIRRLNTETNTIEYIGYADNNGSYKDYTAAARVTYEYMVIANTADGYTTNSDPVEATLYLEGLWIHDPLNPDTTLHQYRYGKDTRGDSLDISSASQKFAGRTDPVFYFGDQEDTAMNARVDFLPEVQRTEAESLRSFIRLRRTLCVRENRGRKMFGVLGGFRNDDNEAGASVTFSVSKVSYSESVV